MTSNRSIRKIESAAPVTRTPGREPIGCCCSPNRVMYPQTTERGTSPAEETGRGQANSRGRSFRAYLRKLLPFILELTRGSRSPKGEWESIYQSNQQESEGLFLNCNLPEIWRTNGGRLSTFPAVWITRQWKVPTCSIPKWSMIKFPLGNVRILGKRPFPLWNQKILFIFAGGLDLTPQASSTTPLSRISSIREGWTSFTSISGSIPVEKMKHYWILHPDRLVQPVQQSLF